MASKPNEKTHKVIACEFRVSQLFIVPIDWDNDLCNVKEDILVYAPTGAEVEGMLDRYDARKYPRTQFEETLEDNPSLLDLWDDEWGV